MKKFEIFYLCLQTNTGLSGSGKSLVYCLQREIEVGLSMKDGNALTLFLFATMTRLLSCRFGRTTRFWLLLVLHTQLPYVKFLQIACLCMLPIVMTLNILFVKGGQGAVRKDNVADRKWKQGRGESGVWRRTTWRQGLLHPAYRVLWCSGWHEDCQRRGIFRASKFKNVFKANSRCQLLVKRGKNNHRLQSGER